MQRNPGHHPEVIKVYKKEFAGGVAPLPETVQAKIQEFKAAPEASPERAAGCAPAGPGERPR